MNDSDKSAEQRLAEAIQRSAERGTDWSQAWALLTASAATFGGLPRELQGARLEPFHCRAVVERIRELEIMERERCPKCGRYIHNGPYPYFGGDCIGGVDCLAKYAALLESRALAAEARMREAVEVLENDAGMPPVDAMDWRYIQRRDALAILTREPEPARKPEVTP